MNTKKSDGYTQGDLFPDLLPKGEKAKSQKKPSRRVVKKTSSFDENEESLAVENKRLKGEINALKSEVKKMQAKVDAYDSLMNSKSLFSTGVVAKSFGWSAVKLNKYLETKKVQYFKSGIWMLYQKYAKYGYTGEQFYSYHTDQNGVARTKAHTYWTLKGYEFIRGLLKEDNLI